MSNLKEKQAEMRQRMQQQKAPPLAASPAVAKSEPPKVVWEGALRVDAANPILKEPPKVRVDKQTVFSVSHGFKPDSNAGDFLDALIGLCAEPPEYLHPPDAVRYLYLLPLLKAFFTHNYSRPNLRSRLVANLTIEELCCWDVLEQWVRSYYGRGTTEAHPLLPHFALDAKQFILAHALGRSHIMREIRNEYIIYSVEPMVKPELNQQWMNYDDKSFRSDFTRENGGRWAKGIVPEGGRIKSLYSGKPNYAAPGAVFYFRIDRCHLSEGWNDHHIAACEKTPRAFDLMDEFVFSGEIKGTPRDIPTCDMPARWFTHGRTYDIDKREHEWVPLPWLGAEINPQPSR
jgi:hypothetical protein